MNRCSIVKDKITLRHIREKLQLTQEEFSKLLDMSRITLIRYENAQREPKFTVHQIKKLLSLLKASGYTLDDLN